MTLASIRNTLLFTTAGLCVATLGLTSTAEAQLFSRIRGTQCCPPTWQAPVVDGCGVRYPTGMRVVGRTPLIMPSAYRTNRMPIRTMNSGMMMPMQTLPTVGAMTASGEPIGDLTAGESQDTYTRDASSANDSGRAYDSQEATVTTTRNSSQGANANQDAGQVDAGLNSEGQVKTESENKAEANLNPNQSPTLSDPSVQEKSRDKRGDWKSNDQGNTKPSSASDSKAKAAQKAPRSRTGNGQRQVSRQLSQLVSSKLYLWNQNVIELSKMAQQQSDKEAVNQLAQTLIDSHEKLQGKLKPSAPAFVTGGSEKMANSVASAAGNEQTRKDSSAGEKERVRTGRANYNRAASPLVRQVIEIERDASRNRLESVKSELGSLSGDAFNQQFVAMQIANHAEMIACLEALEEKDLGELQAKVKSMKKTIEDHLSSAKQLHESMKQGG